MPQPKRTMTPFVGCMPTGAWILLSATIFASRNFASGTIRICLLYTSVGGHLVIPGDPVTAAESHVDRSITQPDLFLKTNVLGTGVLLDACRRHGVTR